MTAFETYDFLMRIVGGRIAMPVFDVVPGPTAVPVLVLLVATVSCSLTLAAGYRSSVMAALTAALTALPGVWDQQTYSSHRLLITLLCCYLAVGQSGAGWSIDARLRGRGNATVPYWPQLLMMCQISACYLFAALSKINPAFLQGHVLRLESWIPLPVWLSIALAAATIPVELLLALGLWGRRVRWPAAVVGLGLHLSIVLMLQYPAPLVAFSLACVSVYPMFLTRRVRARQLSGQLRHTAPVPDTATRTRVG